MDVFCVLLSYIATFRCRLPELLNLVRQGILVQPCINRACQSVYN